MWIPCLRPIPRIVPDARPIAELTYREMRELSYAGFGVLHDEAIVPAVHAGIPICIRNTNRPDAPGTRIVPERAVTTRDRVRGHRQRSEDSARSSSAST